MARFGEANDGGYLACANLLGGVKSAYSYGIAGYDGWGCDISRRLNVTTHQYDCFDTTEPVCTDGSTRFHAECVAPNQTTVEGRLFDTVENQLRANGDAGNRVVVKMDIEGAEWETLLTMPESVLTRIDQLMVEFHRLEQPHYVETVRRLKRYFHVVHVHYNNHACGEENRPFPSWAFEALFVNKRIGIVDRARRPQLPNPLDTPSNLTRVDCQAPLQ